jgi:hypothetical protein
VSLLSGRGNLCEVLRRHGASHAPLVQPHGSSCSEQSVGGAVSAVRDVHVQNN